MHAVYELIDPITEAPHYIGYSSNPKRRIYGHLINITGTKEKRIWIAKLKKQGLKPIMRVVKEYASAEELPYAEEYWYSIYIKRGEVLYNDPFYIGEGGKYGRKLSKKSKNNLQQLRISNPTGAVLTKEDVIKIKKLMIAGHTTKDIATMYSVGFATINNIRSEKSWYYIKVDGFDTRPKSKTSKSISDKICIKIKKLMVKGLSNQEIISTLELDINKRTLVKIRNGERSLHILVDGFIPKIKPQHGTKLTNKDVKKIKLLLKENIISGRKIAQMFNVSPGVIYDIKNNITYKHII